MLNIYNYIISRDIREHLQSIDYKFSAPQAAFLIYINNRITLDEKINAWMKIVNEMPDCTWKGSHYRKDIDSFHEFLKEYIELQKKKLQLFFAEDDDATYSHCGAKTDWKVFRSKRFKTYAGCKQDYCTNKPDYYDPGVRFVKEWLGDREITVDMNPKLEVTKVTIPHNTKLAWHVGYENDLLTEEEYLTDDVFEMTYFSFPVPFQKGDVLAACDTVKNHHAVTYKDLYVVSENGMRPNYDIDDEDATIVDAYPSLYHFGYSFDPQLEIKFDMGGAVYLNFEKREPPSTLEGQVISSFSNWIKEEINIDTFLDTYNKYLATKSQNGSWIYQVSRIKSSVCPTE